MCVRACCSGMSGEECAEGLLRFVLDVLCLVVMLLARSVLGDLVIHTFKSVWSLHCVCWLSLPRPVVHYLVMRDAITASACRVGNVAGLFVSTYTVVN